MSDGGGAAVPDREDRLAALEQRVARLEAASGAEPARGQPGAAAADGGSGPGPAGPAAEPDDDVFWALHGLQARVGPPGAVLFTGTVTLPGGGQVEWQEGRLAAELLDHDWSQAAASLSALAHPVRLLLLREVLQGITTAAQLSEHPGLGTSGQLYHHLRQLVSAGWLRSSARGQYDVPADRVVPLLTVLAATRR
jgi:DNA-binding transcriptional ArsR family regulator